MTPSRTYLAIPHDQHQDVKKLAGKLEDGRQAVLFDLSLDTVLQHSTQPQDFPDKRSLIACVVFLRNNPLRAFLQFVYKTPFIVCIEIMGHPIFRINIQVR